ncbi:SCO family protein [Paenibacillus rhizoplanae]
MISEVRSCRSSVRYRTFSLENVDGKQISLADTAGTARLVYFFFTVCPDVCPITTYMLSETQDILVKDGSFGKDVEFVSISFDPKNDTREAIKAFADKFHADYNGWYFLRGIRSRYASWQRSPSRC